MSDKQFYVISGRMNFGLNDFSKHKNGVFIIFDSRDYQSEGDPFPENNIIIYKMKDVEYESFQNYKNIVGEYEAKKTFSVIPYVTNEIKKRIIYKSRKKDKVFIVIKGSKRNNSEDTKLFPVFDALRQLFNNKKKVMYLTFDGWDECEKLNLLWGLKFEPVNNIELRDYISKCVFNK